MSELLDFKGCRQAIFGQLGPVVAVAGRFGYPQNHLQVTQTAGRFLAVGLKRVGCVVKFVVALVQFQCFGYEECLRVNGRHEPFLEIAKQGRAAGDQAGFQQRRLHGHVFVGLAQAGADGAHTGANFKACVPATANELFQPRLQRSVVVGRLVVRQQQQHVHVGVRKQLPAAKPAHRNQGKRLGQAGTLPQILEQAIGQRRQLVQRCVDTARGCTTVRQRTQQSSFVRAVLGAQGAELNHGGMPE